MVTKVFKFGGAAISTPTLIANVKEIIVTQITCKVVVIISAMGKTTNALDIVFRKYLKDKEHGLKLLDQVVDEHAAVATELGLDESKYRTAIERFIIENLSAVEGSRNEDLIHDHIISLGELFSTTLLTEYLMSQGLLVKWMDVRNMIMTNDSYGNATVNLPGSKVKISKKIKKQLPGTSIIITQGFLGSDKHGHTTTLGREGSDYTAAIFAYALNVESLTIWKDVPGVMTADPALFSEASLLEKVSYREAIEMTYYGAKVIHPKTIQPIQNKGIKLYVRSFIDLKSSGTVIGDPGAQAYPPIIVFDDNVILISITRIDFSFIDEEHLNIIFSKLIECKLRMMIMRNSAISFTLCLKDADERLLTKFHDGLKDKHKLMITKGHQLLTVRHYEQKMLDNLIRDRKVLFEETLDQTIQLVLEKQS